MRTLPARILPGVHSAAYTPASALWLLRERGDNILVIMAMGEHGLRRQYAAAYPYVHTLALQFIYLVRVRGDSILVMVAMGEPGQRWLTAWFQRPTLTKMRASQRPTMRAMSSTRSCSSGFAPGLALMATSHAALYSSTATRGVRSMFGCLRLAGLPVFKVRYTHRLTVLELRVHCACCLCEGSRN